MVWKLASFLCPSAMTHNKVNEEKFKILHSFNKLKRKKINEGKWFKNLCWGKVELMVFGEGCSTEKRSIFYLFFGHLVLCWCRGPTYMEGKMTYPEFVWFLLSEEDKKHPRRWIYVPFIFYQFTVIKQIVGSCKVEPPCFVMVSENLPRH